MIKAILGSFFSILNWALYKLVTFDDKETPPNNSKNEPARERIDLADFKIYYLKVIAMRSNNRSLLQKFCDLFFFKKKRFIFLIGFCVFLKMWSNSSGFDKFRNWSAQTKKKKTISISATKDRRELSADWLKKVDDNNQKIAHDAVTRDGFTVYNSDITSLSVLHDRACCKPTSFLIKKVISRQSMSPAELSEKNFKDLCYTPYTENLIHDPIPCKFTFRDESMVIAKSMACLSASPYTNKKIVYASRFVGLDNAWLSKSFDIANIFITHERIHNDANTFILYVPNDNPNLVRTSTLLFKRYFNVDKKCLAFDYMPSSVILQKFNESGYYCNFSVNSRSPQKEIFLNIIAYDNFNYNKIVCRGYSHVITAGVPITISLKINVCVFKAGSLTYVYLQDLLINNLISDIDFLNFKTAHTVLDFSVNSGYSVLINFTNDDSLCLATK